MFLPDTFSPDAQDKVAEEKTMKRQAIDRVEKLALDFVPQPYRQGLVISVQEFMCGDPQCSPIDTSVSLIFESGGSGMTSIPMEVSEVTAEDLKRVMPDEKTLKAWFEGKEAIWPPLDDDDDEDFAKLRFDVGDHVECRVDADPITGWASGRVIQLWYRETSWAQEVYAPYKIELDDGRKIFAPADIDQVIRKPI